MVFKELGGRNIFPLKKIVDLLKKRPEIREINSHMHHVYLQNVKRKEEKVLRDIK